MQLRFNGLRGALLLGAPLVLGALVILDAASIALAEESLSLHGFILGQILAAGQFAAIFSMNKANGGLKSAAAATGTAIVELSIACLLTTAIVISLTGLFPGSVLGRIIRSDRVVDMIVLMLLFLAGMVAMRSWLKHAQQRRSAQRATLEALEARALLAERERALMQSEMTLMRAQIEPHFLWNTLAHVRYLAKKQPEQAEVLTGHLIGYLRRSLPRTRTALSTVGEEVECSRSYLEMMKIRMGERLQILVTANEQVKDRPFPPLLIQTLVENAIKHGVEPKVGPVSVRITAGEDPADAAMLFVEVADDGVGFQSGITTSGTRMGLSNVRARLRLQYGDNAKLEVAAPREGGALFRIVVPASTQQGEVGSL